MQAGDAETREVLRAEIRAGDEGTRGVIDERTAALLAVVAAESRETRQHARMLHGDVIERIEVISQAALRSAQACLAPAGDPAL